MGYRDWSSYACSPSWRPQFIANALSFDSRFLGVHWYGIQERALEWCFSEIYDSISNTCIFICYLYLCNVPKSQNCKTWPVLNLFSPQVGRRLTRLTSCQWGLIKLSQRLIPTLQPLQLPITTTDPGETTITVKHRTLCWTWGRDCSTRCSIELP